MDGTDEIGDDQIKNDSINDINRDKKEQNEEAGILKDKFSNAGFSSNLSMIKAKDIPRRQVVPRSRKWSGVTQSFTERRVHRVCNVQGGPSEPVSFRMNRNAGVLTFFPNMICSTSTIWDEMLETETVYRQY